MIGACFLAVLVVLPTQLAALEEMKKPPRPEKMDEAIPERPSEYHVWREGRWKWKRKDQEWIWKSGTWSFDHDYYRWKNFNRFNRFGLVNSVYRSRVVAVPVARGYYRLVRVFY